MDEVIIQPIGGFAGAGAPGHLRSEGRVATHTLSAADRAAVETLFASPRTAPGTFRYRLTRRSAGREESVDVPAEAVPATLTASIKTTLE